ncbi:MAG: response regulator [Deferribacterales bacterium]
MSGKGKILVVDDAPENVHILLNILKHDFKVFVATSGIDALKMAEETDPDIILLDIMMPEMDGYEVVSRLKSNPSTDMIPVMFITSLSEIEEELKGLSMGVVDYITKPFHPELVKLRVERHMELNAYRKHLSDIIHDKTQELEQVNRSKNLLQSVMIESLGTLAEYRDPETGGHIKRTQSYIKALARHLKKKGKFTDMLTEEYIGLLYLSAPLHDVGKVGVHDSILQKPDRLTDEEFEEMKRHTIYGYNALRKAEIRLGKNSFINVAMKIAYTHHERWDGSGYPQGLKGDSIPLSGRLMAIADVYDALISKRVYKDPFSHEKACDIIINGDGRTMPSHFDPDILEAFSEIEPLFRNIAVTFADYEEERHILEGGDIQPGESMKQINSILLVEDHEINMAVMKAQLGELGYRIDSAVNGLEALRLLKVRDVDLILTDLNMPVMDGYTLVKTLRDEGSEIPVLAITSNDYDMNNTKAKELGFNGYLLKPIEEDVFQSKIYQISNFGDTHHDDEPVLTFTDDRIIDFSFIEDLAPERDKAVIFMNEYLESNKTDYEQLVLASQTQNPECVRKAAHRLKSSANMFGADRLSFICNQIETAAMKGELDNLAEDLDTVNMKIVEIAVEVGKYYE